MAGSRVVVVLAAGSLGLLFALGSLVAALFELQGFGDRDGEPSTGYLILLALALLVSLGLPLVLWRLVLPRSFSIPVAIAVTVAGLVGVGWILGATA